jgi:glycosyltransferase involved in cell wall biosynthesis
MMFSKDAPCRVLHIIPAFYPAIKFGGPVLSTYHLCNGLAKYADLDVRVLTTSAAGSRRSDNLPIRNRPEKFPAGYDVYMYPRRYGASVSIELLAAMFSQVRWADVVHLTAVYSFPAIPALLSARMTGTPVIWSPRGAFSRWDARHRVIAKSIWDGVCRALCNMDTTFIHYTSSLEAETAIHAFRRFPSRIIANGVPVSNEWNRSPGISGGDTRAIYIGRFHPIKGIENFLQAVGIAQTNVTLRLFGDGDKEYRRMLTAQAHALGIQDRISFHGMIDEKEKEQMFASADVLVLPSHSENFAMVIAESLAHAVPVIVSAHAPWSGVVDHGCGWWVPNDAASLAAALDSCRTSDLVAMGARGREWMRRAYSIDAVSRAFHDTYLELRATAHR